MVGFDEYDRKARVTPGLLALAPIAVLSGTFGWAKYPAISTLGGLLAAAGGAFLLAVIVRERGLAIQADLWASWGGPPTTSRLRNSGGSNLELRTRERDAVESLTGVSLLSAIDEANDPEGADRQIEAAVKLLTSLGQREEYPLVAKENIEYGFFRNLYGLRWTGSLVALACTAANVAALALGSSRFDAGSISNNALAAGLVVEVAFFLGWILIPSANRARHAGDRYAEQLMKAAISEHDDKQGAK